jgi:hypothetical protein
MVKRFQERYEIIDDHLPHHVPMKFSRFCYAIKFHYRISGECEREEKKSQTPPPSTYRADARCIYNLLFLTSALSIMYIYRSCNIFKPLSSILYSFRIGQCNAKETWNKTGTSGN